MTSTAPTLEYRDVSREFVVRTSGWRHKAHVRAVEGVSLSCGPRRTVALVGESGCGKSTVARMGVGLLGPTAGNVLYNGSDLGSLSANQVQDFHRDVQIVFQDSVGALNPRRTVGQSLRAPIRLHSLTATQGVEALCHEVLERVGLTPASTFMRRYPHQLSGGQRQRVCIARAVSMRPSLIIADEPTSALDASLRAQILSLFKELQEDLAVGYLLITHDLSVVRSVADEVVVMYLGRIVESGPTDVVFDSPQHPYTQALLASVPSPRPDSQKLRALDAIAGEVPSASSPPSGCHFHPRCPFAMAECSQTEPPLVPHGDGTAVACHVVEANKARSSSAIVDGDMGVTNAREGEVRGPNSN